MSDDLNEKMLQALAHQSAGRPDPGPSSYASRTVDWRTLTDERAPVEWGALRAWVEWFTVRFDVPANVVPDCWWRHGEIVEELAALRSAHLLLFDPSDRGTGPSTWLQYLSTALPRLTRAGGGCTREHREQLSRSWVNTTDEQAWTAWVTQSHAHQDGSGRP